MKLPKKYLKLSTEEKLSLVNRYREGESITKITSEYGISRTIFYKWLKKYKSSRKKRLEKRFDPLPIKGKKHWRKLSVRKEREVIALWLNNPDYSVRKIASFTGQSTGGVFNIIDRYKKDKAHKAPSALKRYHRKTYKALTRLQKIELINRHMAGEPITKLTQEAGVSRTIFYRWIREFEHEKVKEIALTSRRPAGESHWRFISGVREMVLDVIAQNPALSLSGIAIAVNNQGATVSRSGLYYMLKNMQLSTYESRLAYLERQKSVGNQDRIYANRYNILQQAASLVPQFAVFTIFWFVATYLALNTLNAPVNPGGQNNIANSPTNSVQFTGDKESKKPEIYIAKSGKSDQDFRWGALSLNSPRSSYAPGEDIKLGFGVVDHAGNTVCDGLIGLKIVGPEGDKIFESGVSGESVTPSGQCSLQSVTNTADYLAAAPPIEKTGEYLVKTTASTYEGSREFSHKILVRNDNLFDIERSSYPSRVFPLASYPVEIIVKAKKDFSGNIEDHLPKGINATDVSSNGFVLRKKDEEKIVRWEVNLKAGKSYKISYTLHFAQVWPEFYEIGPMTFTDKKTGRKVFTEERYWQVVADAL